MRQIAAIAVFVLGLSVPACAADPSFECGTATSAVEKAICKSDELSLLDRQIYEESSGAEASGQITFADQMAWWSKRDKACAPDQKVDCLRQVLMERHTFLSALPRPPDEYRASNENEGVIVVDGTEHDAYFSHDPAEVARRVKDFNRHASNLRDARRVVSCDWVVDVRAGTQNHLYAGACRVSENGAVKSAIVCNAAMVWHFHVLDLGGKTPTAKDMAAFAARYCSPA